MFNFLLVQFYCCSLAVIKYKTLVLFMNIYVLEVFNIQIFKYKISEEEIQTLEIILCDISDLSEILQSAVSCFVSNSSKWKLLFTTLSDWKFL